MNSIAAMESIWQDVRYAFRMLCRKPALASTIVLILALAIGGNTAMFTVIRAVLLKPLQYRDPDRLIITGGATPTRFAEMKASAQSFTELGAFTGQEDVTLVRGAEPEVLKAARVSASFLRILKVDPLHGRGFRDEEDSPGGPPVAMISAELWERRFGGDPRIAGQTATIAETPYTVIGVLPHRFQFPSPGVDVWMTAPSEWPLISSKSRALSPYLNVFGRLKPAVTFEQANAELRVIRSQYAMAHPAMLDTKSKTPNEAKAMKDSVVGGIGSMLWMLFGAVGFVLLIACANIASLLLARAASREREFAVRTAIGAGRTHLVRQLLAESLLLSLIGGALGVLLAAFSLRTILTLTTFELPRAAEIHLDWMVLGFAAALSITAGVLFGLAPSLGASRPDLIRSLRTSGGAAHAGLSSAALGWNIRSVLSAGQVALSIVLLIGAALLMESVAHLRHVDIGFNPANLLTMRISLSPVRYGSNQKSNAFFQELVRRTESLPGVRSATATLFLPMMGFAGTPVQDATKPLLKLNERTIMTISVVMPGYFQTLGIPLRRGREFTERDIEDAQRVTIIDEACARHFWPAYPAGEDPIGQRLLIGGANPTAAEIVGIVAGIHQNLEKTGWPESVYLPFAQSPPRTAMLAVRTSGNPLTFTRAVREQVQTLDQRQPIAAVHTMDELVEAQIGQRRLLLVLLESFAGVALLLAVIGIYGVIAYSVAQRTQEMGIRRALGAQEGDILRLVIGQGIVLTLAGIGVGLGGAFALTRLMKTLLFGVSASDPVTFAGIAILFLVVALTASYIPARRAARIDPMTALRV